MVKLVVRICAFFLIFALILSWMNDCSGTLLDKFLDGDKIEDNDVARSDPFQFNGYMITQIVSVEHKCVSFNTININISQEINMVNIEIEDINQSISNQTNFIDKTTINQNRLINWYTENKSQIAQLGRKQEALNEKISELKSEITAMRKEIRRLEKLLSSNERYFTSKIELNDYESKKFKEREYKKMIQELNKRIRQLDDKIESLSRELSNNNEKMKDLDESIEKCIHKLEKLNNKIDSIIEGSCNNEQADVENINYHFIIGTEEELKDNNIISSDGLFGGLKVNPSPDKQFFGILTDKNKTIVLGGEDEEFEVVSDHPADSYEFRTVNRAKILVINDIDRFWGNSVYLVIIRKMSYLR